MRKKSILMVCISALMALTMFVGCDNAPVLPSFVVGGTINQTGDFLEGQTFDPSKFTVTITYDNGRIVAADETVSVYLDKDTGETGKVNAGDTVKADLGKNYADSDICATAAVRVYSIKSIAVTGPESYAVANTSFEVPVSDLTVTATYLDSSNAEKTMVLVPGEYTVDPVSLPTLSEDNPTVEASAKVTANIGKFLDVASETQFDFTATWDGESTKLPEGAEIESISAAFVKDFSFNQLNYGDEAPAIDGSRIEVTAKVVGDNKEYKVASSDVEFSLVDKKGLPLINYNFFDNKVSQVYVKASYEGFEAITQAVDVFEVTVSVQLAGFEAPEAIYAGGELPEITGVRYVWETENGAGIIPADEVKLVYAYTATAEPTVEGSTRVVDELVAGNYLMVYPVYKGVPATEGIYLGYVETPATTIESVEFSMAEGWKAPAKQYYNTDKLPSLAKTSVVDIVVTTSVGVEEYDSANDSTAFTVAYYTAEGKPLSEAKATEGECDVLANVDSILVGLTLGDKTYYKTVALEEPVYTELTAKVVPNGTTVGSTVNLSVIAWNVNGNVNKDFKDYIILDEIGNPVDSINLVLGVKPVNYTIYARANDYEADGTVTIPAGIGYIAPKAGEVKLVSTETEELSAVGTQITVDLVKKYFKIDETSYDPIAGKDGAPDAPAITGVKVPSKQTLATGENEISVVIEYVDAAGKNVKQNTNVTIVGTAYVSTMDASPVVLYDGKEITKLEQGTRYDISKFTISPDSYSSVGELTIGNPEVTCTGSFVDVAAGTVTGDSASNYTFTFNYYSESTLTESEKKIEVTLGVFPEV